VCNDLNILQMQPGREQSERSGREQDAPPSTPYIYPTLSSGYLAMRTRWGPLLVMTAKTSVPPACNRLIISHDDPVRLCRQQVRTLLYLLSSDRELDALTGLDPGLDEGADGIDGEEHDDGKNETEEEVEAGVSHLSTDSLDAHVWDHARLLEDSGLTVLVVAADLAPFPRRVDDGVLKKNMQ